ncbi:MAG: ACP S-malonyltransferase [Burkholderiaceae bacterium]|jgi:[acyl-carrier-protein] S-malonyltransferase|nr:ACP S-malonyltransferase [Burkholderiaceae bacterium]
MTTPSSLAIVFPGQGSQSVGMLDAWADNAVVRDTLAEASEALGEDLAALIANGPAEALSLTTNTQPVMLVAGVAAYRAWLQAGGARPAWLAGHSLGEYAALVAAGSLTLAQAAPLVRLRAQAMQEAVPVGQGAMAAILGMPSQEVVRLCSVVQRSFSAESGEVVEAVNFNDPNQTVIAGSKVAVEQAMVEIKAAGAKRALPLPVSAPFHSSLMKPASIALAQRLQDVDLLPPQIAVLNNVDVMSVSEPAAIKDALVRQAFGAVRWVESVQKLKAHGVATVLECGPGKVLTGMAKRIEPELNALAVYDPATLDAAVAALA